MRARLVAIALVSWACSGPLPPSDPDGGRPLDAPSDAPRSRPPRMPDGGRVAYGPCASSADCPSGLRCNVAPPRGSCTTSCTTAEECPDDGDCLSGTCFQRCVVGAGTCPADQRCAVIAVGSLGHAVCQAACSMRDDADVAACPERRTCDDVACVPAVAVAPPANVGAPCAGEPDCVRSGCVHEALGGMCVQTTRMIDPRAYRAPGPFPTGGCVDGQAIVPLGSYSVAEGDSARCVPRCVADDDCRDGFRCDRYGTYDAARHEDGACVPWICEGSYEDVPCDPSRSCVPLADSSRAACFRVGADGGV